MCTVLPQTGVYPITVGKYIIWYISYRVISCHIIYNVIYHTISYHIMSHVISYNIMLSHIISYNIILCHIMSRHISYHISFHVMKYITSYHTYIIYIVLYHISFSLPLTSDDCHSRHLAISTIYVCMYMVLTCRLQSPYHRQLYHTPKKRRKNN
jgi:hypothetical protein